MTVSDFRDHNALRIARVIILSGYNVPQSVGPHVCSAPSLYDVPGVRRTLMFYVARSNLVFDGSAPQRELAALRIEIAY